MKSMLSKTTIYLVCFHSVKPGTMDGTKSQYFTVEEAILNNEWPYDNGDDPSFYAARRGGPLTWGVCREDLRNSITRDSIVVFFSFTPLANERILYRLCAVETVVAKLDHRDLHRDERFSQYKHLYINGLIRPDGNHWLYDEKDRPGSARHEDWLWRMADHRRLNKEVFTHKQASVYRRGWFSERDVLDGRIRLADNYVVFSTPPDRAFISPYPPEVAVALPGQHEQWTDQRLRNVTVGVAARFGRGRDYLRVSNNTNRNVHRQIRFCMTTTEAHVWRDDLIDALKHSKVARYAPATSPIREIGAPKCR